MPIQSDLVVPINPKRYTDRIGAKEQAETTTEKMGYDIVNQNMDIDRALIFF